MLTGKTMLAACDSQACKCVIIKGLTPMFTYRTVKLGRNKVNSTKQRQTYCIHNKSHYMLYSHYITIQF